MGGNKCKCVMGVLLLLVGLLYLGADMGWWSFWTVSWWTMAFLFMGLCKCMASMCCDKGSCKTKK